MKNGLSFWFYGQNPKTAFFGQKMPSFTFWPYLPFSNAFLWSRYSWIDPNFLNLVRNFNFGRHIRIRLDTLGKTGKNQKTVLPDTFLVLTPFNIQNKCKLHSDQVSRHSICKKYDFGPYFHFSWSHPENGYNFWKNQKVALFSHKTGSDGFPVPN